MIIRVGQSFSSTVDSTTVIVIRAPEREVSLACGGSEMVVKGTAGASAGDPDPELQGGTLLGKRYVDDASQIELLCVTAGPGTLTLDGEALAVQQAKPLPSSD